MPGARRFFGDGLTNLKPNELKGKLIAIEGTDGVGRSTHIAMLQEWLEVQGYGVITTGWTRSSLEVSEFGSCGWQRKSNVLRRCCRLRRCRFRAGRWMRRC